MSSDSDVQATFDLLAMDAEDFVRLHEGFVWTIAQRLARNWRTTTVVSALDVDDLFSVGACALLEARTRFSPAHGVGFTTFAKARVRGAMLDEIRRRDQIPRRLRQTARAISKAEGLLAQHLGRWPTASELADALAMPVSRLHQIRAHFDSHVESGTLAEDTSSAIPSPAELLEKKRRYDHLAQALLTLSPDHQLVLDLYFHQELKLREIAEIMSLTVGRVSQIKADALGALRDRLPDD